MRVHKGEGEVSASGRGCEGKCEPDSNDARVSMSVMGREMARYSLGSCSSCSRRCGGNGDGDSMSVRVMGRGWCGRPMCILKQVLKCISLHAYSKKSMHLIALLYLYCIQSYTSQKSNPTTEKSLVRTGFNMVLKICMSPEC